MKLTPERKAEIDAKSYEALSRGWRYAPVGSPWFQDECGAYWAARMLALPKNADILLAGGEMSASELRTVKAVLQWFIATRVTAFLAASEGEQNNAGINSVAGLAESQALAPSGSSNRGVAPTASAPSPAPASPAAPKGKRLNEHQKAVYRAVKNNRPDLLTNVVERITAYLSSGGLFNPELADRDAVRDLLIDARDALLAESEGEQTMAGAARSSSDAAAIPDAGVTPAPAPSDAPHTDHPLRHWDRTCPACVAAGAAPSDAPTPETDYVAARRSRYEHHVPTEFARRLEHQRDALQAKLDAAQELAGRETLSAAYWKAKAEAAQSATPRSGSSE